MTHPIASARPRVRVLVLHREAIVSHGIQVTLGREPGLQVQGGTPPDAGPFDVIVCDHDTGLSLARWGSLHGEDAAEPKLLVIGGRTGDPAVQQALAKGVHGYLPLDAPLDVLVAGVKALGSGQPSLVGARVGGQAADAAREVLAGAGMSRWG